MLADDRASRAHASRLIVRHHAPLVLQAVLFACAGPVLQHALARAAVPTTQIAGFWLAFALAAFLQSGALAVQQATLAAVRAGGAPGHSLRAALLVGALSSGLVLALGLAAASDGAALHWSGAPAAVRTIAGHVLVTLAPAPVLIAIRGHAFARLLAGGRPASLAWGGALRIVALALACAPGFVAAGHEAAGAARALVLALALEAAFGWGWMLRTPAGEPAATARGGGFFRALAPVVAGLLAWSAVRPLVNAVLGQLASPLEAQASFGATLPVVMLAGAPLWCLFDVTLALVPERASFGALVKHAAGAAGALSGALLLMAWPPSGELALGHVFGVPAELRAGVASALPWLALLPPVLAVRAVASGLLLRSGASARLLALAPLRIATVLGVGLLVARMDPGVPGASLGVALVLAGDALEAGLLVLLVRRQDAPGVRWDSARTADGALREAA